MRRAIAGLDHAVICVRDLEHASDTYARLGFTLTPRGFHTLGSQNHCIMLGADYLELLAVPRPHPALADFVEFLARGEGLAALALRSPDADAGFAELAAAGIAPRAPVDFARPVALPGGAREARFRIVQLPAEATPGCRMFLCRHFTPELVWRPEHQRHALGATAIAAVAIVADDPAAAARPYAQLFDATPRPIDEGLLIETGAAPLALAARGRLGRRLAGVGMPARPRPLAAALFLRVADRARAARVLERGGFRPVRLPDGSLGVDAERAHGVTLVFG